MSLKDSLKGITEATATVVAEAIAKFRNDQIGKDKPSPQQGLTKRKEG